MSKSRRTVTLRYGGLDEDDVFGGLETATCLNDVTEQVINQMHDRASDYLEGVKRGIILTMGEAGWSEFVRVAAKRTVQHLPIWRVVYVNTIDDYSPPPMIIWSYTNAEEAYLKAIAVALSDLQQFALKKDDERAARRLAHLRKRMSAAQQFAALCEALETNIEGAWIVIRVEYEEMDSEDNTANLATISSTGGTQNDQGQD